MPDDKQTQRQQLNKNDPKTNINAINIIKRKKTVTMSKPYEFNWQPNIPGKLLKGEMFDKWDEETGLLEENVLFRVDECGFFLYWQPEGKVS